MKRNLYYFLFVASLFVIDQVSKAVISKKIALMSAKSIIPGFLNLTHVRNTGAVFGFFSGSGNRSLFIVLTLASLTALGFVVYYFVRTAPSQKLMKFSLSLILAGALGNLLDRVLRGYVVDFIDFYIKKSHWPAFNVADSCITIGAVLIVSAFILKRKSKCSLCSSN
jgi:signal peptidase II